MAATTTVSTKKINKVRIRRIPLAGEEDKRPIKGYELCPHLHANIYLVAKKMSGKTTVIYNMLERCMGRDTKVFAFVSTLNNDVNWQGIQKLCEDKDIPFFGFTSIVDEEGVDQLQALVKSFQDTADPERKEERPAPPESSYACWGATEPAAPTPKPKRTPYQAPEVIIILDDLADELKKKSVATLLKKNRHFKSKVIVSSQWLNDIPPAALGQMSLVCLFRGFSIEKLEEFHNKARLAVPMERFIEMYKDATAKDFGFLCIDTEKNTYRKEFDQQYI